jgi:hypothetical protein
MEEKQAFREPCVAIGPALFTARFFEPATRSGLPTPGAETYALTAAPATNLRAADTAGP